MMDRLTDWMVERRDMKHTVTVYPHGSGYAQFTAYAGGSEKSALTTMDACKGTLMVAGGRGTIQHRVNGALQRSWDVVDHQFSITYTSSEKLSNN